MHSSPSTAFIFVALLCQYINTTVATWVLVNWTHSKGPRVGMENEGLVAQGQLRVEQRMAF
jgi:hypothetical protein